jgi:outer membrane protein assembly factor BamB
LIALDLSTGEERWRTGESQISYASPALMTLGDRQQIVIVNEADVTGHDIKSGEILWKVDWPGQSNGPASVSQATQLDNKHLLLSKGYGGGSKLLKFPEKFVGPVNVEEVWHHPSIMKTKFMTPVVSGEYVYGLSDGILECIRWADGKKIWKDNRQGRLGHGQMLLVGNQLLCSSEDGRLVLTDATPEKPASYESLSLLEGITWNPIALAGDLVLMRNGEQAVCVRVKRE